MKSPADLAARWLKQWRIPDTREQRLLHRDAWPISLSIGKPTASEFVDHNAKVRQHIQSWRAITCGEVVFRAATYRGGTDPIDIPVEWKLNNSSEWVAAAGDSGVLQEFQLLDHVLSKTPPEFHRTITRQMSLWTGKTSAEVTQVARVAASLSPGCADGRPLRALSLDGVDTKFFERHRTLLTALLDVRFDGRVSDLGLDAFLGAPEDNDHWLLVVPLDPGILNFERQKVRASELLRRPIGGTHLLLVENESSLYQLPASTGTVAILGAGLHLDWLRAPWLAEKVIGYWGDLDTWGLIMLATVRQHQPGVQPLLMSHEVYSAFASAAVSEPAPGPEEPPDHLTEAERALYRFLWHASKGRLEQEFLPVNRVQSEINNWHARHGMGAGNGGAGGRLDQTTTAD